jgi:chromosome segregation protein
MKLTTLEIKGFKSFADKTVVHFNDNMTGIVGPNGCGKSNTIDAIRWVLGEQKSKALRLEKMDNVLFNGTKKRSAAGRAEVSLTFENTRNLLPTEFKTVTISRVIYRSGESEYRLNDVKCRLKDIANLFLDTGISSDSYAIIELKMIDEILNDKEDSRRKLFEQAAGVSKYKTRKKETLAKLEHTDADLTRVEDLLAEIEKNLKTLEKQAKRAEKYYQIKDEYKQLRVELGLFQIAEYKQKTSLVDAQQQTQQDLHLQLDAQIVQLEAQIEREKTAWIGQEQQLASTQKEFNQLVDLLRDKENRKNLVQQNVSFMQQKDQQLAQQIQVAEQLLASLQKEVEVLGEQQQKAGNDVADAKNRLNEMSKATEDVKQRHRTMRAQLDGLQQQFKQAEYRVFEVEKHLAIKHSQREQAFKEQKESQSKVDSQQRDLQMLMKEKQTIEDEITQHDDIFADLQQQEAHFKQQLAELAQNIEQIRQEQQQNNRLLDSKRNEYKLTKSLVDSLEGFPDSIKYLKNNSARWNTTNAPLLLDILNCEERYKLAIENYLKNYLNYYVVQDIETAMQAIALLDKEQKGKAAFFVLNDYEPMTNAAPSSPPIEIGVAALDILKTVDAKYMPLLQYLLKNVYIIHEEKDMELSNSGGKYSYITENGKVIRRPDVLEGGSVGAYEGKRIGKRQHLDQLQKDIEQHEAIAAKLQESWNETRQKETGAREQSKNIEQQLQKHRQHANSLNQTLVSCKVKIDNINNFVRENKLRQSNATDKIEEINEDIGELNMQSSEARQRKDDLNRQIKELEQNYRTVSNELSHANQYYNDQNILFHQQQNRQTTIAQSLDYKQQQLNETQQQYEDNRAELQTTFEKVKSFEAELVDLLDEIAWLMNKRDSKQTELTEQETAYYAARNATDELEKELRTQQRSREQSNQVLQAIAQERNRLDLQFLSVKERLYAECKVEVEDLLSREPDSEQDPVQLEEKVRRLSKQLDNYGEINPMAMEAYKEISERFEFIQVQRDDLLQAKKSLLQNMKEIETTATDLFMTAFNKVRENFIHVFRSLFTEEDHCDLVLIDADNPLDSGIDIIAKPKGKRPQSINQLSGGEKSLTALALVFSLYLLKPAPFCILDEVDAPLDDANVEKFTKIIRQFSQESQFIIVTHNKNTMASVDVIYGVTMHEEGVSTVVPVDFRSLTA